MNTRDKFTIGFTYYAECYCYECGDKLPEIDPDGNDKHPIATWHKADLLDGICAKCGEDIK